MFNVKHDNKYETCLYIMYGDQLLKNNQFQNPEIKSVVSKLETNKYIFF